MEERDLFKPKFSGQRFEDHTLPFDLLDDLSQYEVLLLQVAKEVYYELSGAKRVPKGFGQGVYLKLQKIDEGSTMPAILLAAATSFVVNDVDTLQYFQEAHNRIVRTIETAQIDGNISTILSPESLAFFNKIGKNLQDDEEIDFLPSSPSSGAKLTQVNRRKIVLASPTQSTVESEIRIRGAISALSKDPRQFTIQTKDKLKLVVPIGDIESFETVHKAFEEFESNTRVMITGTGVYNKENKLQDVSDVKTITILHKMDVPTQLEELTNLENGWLNGEGNPFSKKDLTWLSAQFDKHIPQDLLLPYTFPMIEGKVQFEWIKNEHDVTLDIDLDNKTAYYHYYNSSSDEESDETLDLSGVDGWNKLAETLSPYFKVTA